ncbi:lysine 6-monooxygenase [Yersinia pestis subsp. microtus bv. Altaica]|uniref:lysine N(6)-hydroxylase/L-ornithine N(5)-oxygenase family protein n=1 Tax=Yersinia pestis TaxID=632 RepID=UPI0001A7422D|nr:lysine N(6)-hydroxylase/L-ornithine N(5)-oxygenase family protein [Yersinia pestis]AJK12306.1 flavin-binding monooxygenase-like family protein [Yersinia pestis str. Pestoides B]AYW83792.1 lysine 6-monooxygenase [Yersinia pestis]EEO91628.1 putative siderophore biosynthesis protein IucD [Yersinia pestis Pestoides A]KPD88031.1 lysine 6-monooxygenase [Yersinia pestis subsp. microtus bv. Altaica]OML09178.1 lysine 6-monooxygenase [Yersinia pestis subsp. microtus bv. Altaica]
MNQPLDFIGIGIGPFNLSIAALGSEVSGFNSKFLERKPHFSWHPGMMVPDCHMQTCFLKDLVSAVSPTNTYSFLNYLVQHKKFYRFLTTEHRTVSREEFADYLRWAASGMSSLEFSQDIQSVDFDDQQRHFVVTTPRNVYHARHVCLGIGKRIKLPDCVTEQNDRCFHASEMALRNPDLTGKRITIVGGGQSGADLFLNIFLAAWGQPKQLNWISRRNNYNALDEAAFANEYFMPEYVESFYTLNDSAKQHMLAEQRMTSDGITSESLLAIYRAMYHQFEVLHEKPWARLLPSRSLTNMHTRGNGYQLLTHHHLDQGTETFDTDVVIFATGYQQDRPAFLDPLADRLQTTADCQYQVAPDFVLDWQGPRENCLFAVNAGMHSHGIAEPQLSLMAWRSAHILNRALGRTQFDLTSTPAVIQWRSQQSGVPAHPEHPVLNCIDI